jgi:hypothetical protein
MNLTAGWICIVFEIVKFNWGDAVAQLVEALRFKPEGSWVREYFIDIILPAALWSWG